MKLRNDSLHSQISYSVSRLVNQQGGSHVPAEQARDTECTTPADVTANMNAASREAGTNEM